MKKRLVITICLLFAAWMGWQIWAPFEPRYQGRKIGRILDDWVAGENFISGQALAQIGTNALPYVIARLAANDSKWRMAYTEFNNFCPSWMNKILPTPPPPFTKVYGANAFYSIQSNSLPCAIDLLKHPNPNVRQAAALGIGGLRRQSAAANQALPALVEALHSPDRTLRRDVIISLRDFGADASNAIPALAQIVATHDPGAPANDNDPTRANAAYVLGLMRHAAAAAIPALQSAMQEPDPYLSGNASAAFWRITGDAETTLPILLHDMQAMQYADKCWDWIVAMGEMGPRAKDALPQILEAQQKSKGRRFEKTIAIVLQRIDPAALAGKTSEPPSSP